MNRYALLLAFLFGFSLLLAILKPLRVSSHNTINEVSSHSVLAHQDSFFLMGQIPGTHFGDFAIDANWAYVGIGGGINDQLAVIDISSPTQPISVTTLSLSDRVYDIVLKGSFAYLANGEAGLQIVDISHPVAPFNVGSYVGDWIALGVTVTDTYAYVATGGEGLRIIDITEPITPTEVNTFDEVEFAYSVLHGWLSYLSCGLG